MVSRVYGQDLRGFTKYWGSYPGDTVVMYRDRIYVYRCMGRYCEAGNIEWINGGKAYFALVQAIFIAIPFF